MNKSIKCGNCKETHDSVQAVRDCYGVNAEAVVQRAFPGAQVEEMITARQLPFLLTLAAERPMWADVNNLHADVIPKLTKEQANQAITEALTMKPEKATPAAKGKAPEGTRASLRAVPLEDGIYRLDQEDTSHRQSDEHFLVYHTVHGANEQVAKKLLLVDTGETDEDGKTIWKGEWEYAGKKALRFLTPVMKLNEADAKQFGIVYGICVRCARTLTKEESKEVGYGATCAGHEGWWYPTKAELREIKLRAKTEAK